MFDIPLLDNLFIYFNSLVISLIELKNIHQKHKLKEHRRTFKIDKITCSKPAQSHRVEQRNDNLIIQLDFICK